MQDIVYAILGVASIVISISYPAYLIGYEHGLIGLASGKYSCELIENKDKTTDWKCLRVINKE